MTQTRWRTEPPCLLCCAPCAWLTAAPLPARQRRNLCALPALCFVIHSIKSCPSLCVLQAVMGTLGVNARSTTTNHIMEVQQFLGIGEALRQPFTPRCCSCCCCRLLQWSSRCRRRHLRCRRRLLQLLLLAYPPFLLCLSQRRRARPSWTRFRRP